MVNDVSKSDITLSEKIASDKQNIDNFTENKSKSFDVYALKRLVLSELTYNHSFTQRRVCGFTRTQIINMVEHPEKYGAYLYRLSRYFYENSGYYKRIVDYFSNMGVINWTIDTHIKDIKAYTVAPKTIKTNYIKFTSQCDKFKLENSITDILKRIYISDVCFGFISENDIDAPIFFIEPEYCEIRKLVNGNVYEFAVNRSLFTSNYYETLPSELQSLIESSYELSKNNLVMIPYENSLCLKYHNDVTYSLPPFYNLIKDILLINDYKELAKAKTEADAYKLVYLKIPTDDEGKISAIEQDVIQFTEMTKSIVPDSWGVVPIPYNTELIESKSTSSDDRNKVEEATESFYAEAGVSKSIISSASSGSELKLSMKTDSSDLYRIYRQIENWMSLQMKLRNYIYQYYEFSYNLLKTTIFDIDDFIDRQLKLAQASTPNKGLLLAANGINSSKMIGNSYMENNVLRDIFEEWVPLSTSYTQSGDNNAGKPESEETDLKPSGEQTRENDSNANRIGKV